MYEHRHAPLLSRRAFFARLFRHGVWAALLILISLGVGVIGYHSFAGLPWLNSLENASMILTGMGPVDRMEGTGAKLFASGYALFSGVVFLTSMAVLMAPIFHRFLHKFHLEGNRRG